MRYNLIKTNNYLLVVDGSPRLDGELFYSHELDGVTEYFSEYPLDSAKKIIAHRPLNGAPYLDGVPVLPSLADDDVDHLLIEEHEQAIKRGGVNYGTGYYEGLADGYNKAREKYILTWEKLIDLYIEETGYGMDMWGKEENQTMLTITKIIKSLQQPKYPVAFECEVQHYYHSSREFYHDASFVKCTKEQYNSIKTEIPTCPLKEEIKTIINSEGRTEWVGKYIYE